MADAVSFHESEIEWLGDLRGGVMERTGGHARRKMIGDPDLGLFVTLSEYDPNVVIEPHSHNAAEMMFVLAGDFTVDGRRCGPGTVLRFPANTVYGPLTAGPEGTRFLVIRTGQARTQIAE
jgi:quercetin dioxygenase-like cupin family protein